MMGYNFNEKDEKWFLLAKSAPYKWKIKIDNDRIIVEDQAGNEVHEFEDFGEAFLLTALKYMGFEADFV